MLSREEVIINAKRLADVFSKLNIDNENVESRINTWKEVTKSSEMLLRILKEVAKPKNKLFDETKASLRSLVDSIKFMHECGYFFDDGWKANLEEFVNVFRENGDKEYELKSRDNFFSYQVKLGRRDNIIQIQNGIESLENELVGFDKISFLIDKAYFFRQLEEFEKIRITLEPVEKELRNNSDKRAQILRFNALIFLGDGYDREGKYRAAAKQYEKAKEILAKYNNYLYEQEAVVYDKLGNEYQHLGNYIAAEESYKKGLELREKSYGPEHRFSANSYLSLGRLYLDTGCFSEERNAINLLSKAAAIREKLSRASDSSIVLRHLGVAYLEIGDYDNAIEQLNQSMEKRKSERERSSKENNIEAFAINSIYYADLLNYIGYAYLKRGELKKAYDSFTKAMIVFGRDKIKSTDGHRLYAEFLSNFGLYHLMNTKHGAHKTAIEYFEKAQNIIKESMGPDHQEYIKISLRIGQAYMQVENYQKALKYFRASKDAIEKTESTNLVSPILKGKIYYNLAILKTKQKNLEEAKGFIQEALNNFDAVPGRKGLYHGKTYFQEAHIAYEGKQELKEVETLINRALDNFKEILRGENLYNWKVQFEKATILFEHGEYERAKDSLSFLWKSVNSKEQKYLKKFKITVLKRLVDCYLNLGMEEEMQQYTKEIKLIESDKNLGEIEKELTSLKDRERYYVESALLNTMSTSRTVKDGSITIITTRGEPLAVCRETWNNTEQRFQIMASEKTRALDLENITSKTQEQIKEFVQKNIIIATRRIVELSNKINSVEDLKDLIIDTVLQLSEGILNLEYRNDKQKQYKELLRKHDIIKFPYAIASEVEKRLDEFYKEFFSRICDFRENKNNEIERQKWAEETAAWVEYIVNLTDHFYADGCGKIATMLCTLVCALADAKMPVFLNEKDYFQNAPNRPRFDDIKNDIQFGAWILHYRSHFPDFALEIEQIAPDKMGAYYSNEAIENLNRISKYIGKGILGTSGYEGKDKILKKNSHTIAALEMDFEEQINKSIDDICLSLASENKELRKGGSIHYNFEPNDIEKDLVQFYQDIIELRKIEGNYLYIGAMIHYRIGMLGQYFTDGNRKEALILETAILKSKGYYLPEFYDDSIWKACAPVRFYENERPEVKKINDYRNDARFLRWYYGYTTLFKKHLKEYQKLNVNSNSKTQNVPKNEWNVQAENAYNKVTEIESTVFQNIFEKTQERNEDLNIDKAYDKVTKLHQSTGLPIKNLVIYNPERILKHSIIVTLVTSYKIKEDNLREQYNKIFESLKGIVKGKFNIDKDFDKFKNHARKKVEEYSYAPNENSYEFKVIKELKLKISEHENKQKSRLRVTEAKEILTELLTKNLLRSEYYYQMYELVTTNINGLEKLTLKPNNQRTVWVLGGGPASGKSTAAKGAIKLKEGEYCSVNPDFIKKLLLDEDVADHASKTHEESSFIKDLILEQLKEMIQYRDEATNQIVGAAPDILLDVVASDPKSLGGLSEGNPTISLYTVSCDAEKAAQRSYNRAKNEFNIYTNDKNEAVKEKNPDYGRYVPTQIVLSGHKKVSETMPLSLASGIYNSARIFSTNSVGSKQESKEIASYENKTLHITHIEEFWRFLRKTYLNTNAYDEGSLYEREVLEGEGERLINVRYMIHSINQYISQGIELKFLNHTTLSAQKLYSQNFDELQKEFEPKKLEALIIYSMETSMHVPFKAKDLPILRKANGIVLSVFSSAINKEVHGISTKALEVLVSKSINIQQLSATALNVMTENVKQAFISSGITLFNQEIIISNLSKMISKVMNTSFTIQPRDDNSESFITI